MYSCSIEKTYQFNKEMADSILNKLYSIDSNCLRNSNFTKIPENLDFEVLYIY